MGNYKVYAHTFFSASTSGDKIVHLGVSSPAFRKAGRSVALLHLLLFKCLQHTTVNLPKCYSEACVF